MPRRCRRVIERALLADSPAGGDVSSPARLHGDPHLGARMARVLVIDDCKDTLVLFRTVVTKAGHEVQTASSADEGLALLRQSPPDAVLLDVEMPVHDGAWCLREIRNDPNHGRMPVIMVSALPMRELVLRLAQLGVDG